MSDERQARQWCDLLGWEYRERGEPGFLGYVPKPGDVCVWPRADGRFDVAVWRRKNTTGAGLPAREYVVDLPTLAACTLVRHAGPVDVGPCPECEGHCQQWQWLGGGEWVAPDIQRQYAGEDPWNSRPCPACVVDGKPTGHRIVSAPEAVLLAAPQGTDSAECECPECDPESWATHQGARDALRALAETWEALNEARPRPPRCSAELALAVWGDYLEANDQTVAGLRAFAECSDLGAWVLAWLTGECPVCEGHGRIGILETPCDACSSPTHYEHRHDGLAGHGLAVGPHLSAIYAALTAAWERETVPCARDHLVVDGVYYDADARWMPDPPAPPCPACAGLGRVRPEGVPETHAAAQ